MAIISSRFTHDCNECTFRGRLGRYDVYSHNDNVILRFGDDGPDYKCFDRSIILRLPVDSEFHVAMHMCTD